MSDNQYRQNTAQRQNCTQGHWKGIPQGGSNGGCWLCKYGCIILSYLKWKNMEANETNVKKYLNGNADADWSSMGISKHESLQTPCIGKLKSRQHFVYIQSIIQNDNLAIFDPGKRSNTSMKKSDFSFFYY